MTISFARVQACRPSLARDSRDGTLPTQLYLPKHFAGGGDLAAHIFPLQDSSKMVPLPATANTSIKRMFTSQTGTCPLPWQHREPQLPADPSPFSFQPLVPRCTSEQPRSEGQGEGIGTAADKQHFNPWKRCWKCYRPTIPSCCTNITGSCSVLERELKPRFPRPGLRQDSAEPCCCNARENAEEPPVQSCAASLLKLISQPFVPLAWFHSQEKQETVWNKQFSYGWSTSDDF